MKLIKILERIKGVSIYALVFIIPFSKAGVEIFATTAIAAWIILRLFYFSHHGYDKKWLKFFPDTHLNKPVLALFTVAFISMFFSVDISLSSEGVFLKLGEYLLLFFICAEVFLKKDRAAEKVYLFLYIVAVSTLLLFIDATLQWMTGKDLVKGYAAGWRLRASFDTANDFAGWIIAVLPILFCSIFIEFEKLKSSVKIAIKVLLVSLFFIGLIFLAKTFSRGAWLGYLLSLTFAAIVSIAAQKNVKRYLKNQIFFLTVTLAFTILPVIIGICIVEPVAKRLESIEEGFESAGRRIYQWQEALAIIEDFPILGTGPNTYSYVGPNYKIIEGTGAYPHNSYLHMAAEIGILGLGAFLWVLWRFFKEGIRALRAKQDFLLLGIMAGVVATLVQSFFDTNLFALRLIVLFWIMLGVGTARIIYLKEGREEEIASSLSSSQ